MRRFGYPAVAFIVVFCVDALIVAWRSARAASLWGTSQAGGMAAGLKAFFVSGDWYIGLAYALSAAFVVYAFSRLRAGQRSGGAVGIAGGVSAVGILYFASCFLLGCCGSPMLVLYLNWFGASFLGFTKPLVLGLTVVSLAIGYIWMERKAKVGCVDCACETGACDEGSASR